MRTSQVEAWPSPNRCPHLGIRDDKETTFGFPSKWNYCHIVKPVLAVNLEYQNKYCLTENCTQCPMSLTGGRGKIPAEMRAHRQVNRLKVLGWVLFFSILLGAAYWSALSGAIIKSSIFQANHKTFTETMSPAFVEMASSTPSNIPTAMDTLSPPKQPLAVTDVASPTPMQICGYELDAEIHSGQFRFIIHKVSEGDNMELLGAKFDTTASTISAANYSLPVPLWVDFVIVIPVKTTDVTNMPAFEPHYVTKEAITVAELAERLSVPVDDLQYYNGWDQPCRIFSGWMLVPRKKVE